MTNAQRQLAMMLLGSLLIARFVFVPWQQAQNDLIEQNQVSAKRLNKAEQLAGVETDLQQQHAKLSEQQQQMLARLPQIPSTEQAAQHIQQLLQSHFESNSVTVVLFNFQGMQSLTDAKLQTARASIRLSAPMQQLMLSMSSLQQQYPALQLIEWISSNTPTGIDQPFEVFITLDLLVQVTPS